MITNYVHNTCNLSLADGSLDDVSNFACGVALGTSSDDALDILGEIVGGYEVKPHSIPWQVGIIDTTGRKGPYLRCGGTLVSSQHIVTAAHCTYSMSISIHIFDNYASSFTHVLPGGKC